MKFDLENLNPATRFYFDEDDPNGGWIELRPCNGEALADIRKKTEVQKAEYRRGQRIQYVEADEDAQQSEIWSYSIVDWGDIVSGDGEQIECTNENKNLLMRGSVLFASKITGFLKQLNENLGLQAEDSEKN